MTPWISVDPNTNSRAILGNLPFVHGRATFAIPTSVVLNGATGILVFAWASLTGINPLLAPGHVGDSATLFANNLPSATNHGEVEIHGYRPAHA